jgi:hypothetical protein
MRITVRVLALVLLAAAIGCAGCTNQAATPAPATPPAVTPAAPVTPVAPTTVVVPDVFKLLEANADNWTYSGSDLEGSAAEVHAYLEGYLKGLGLKPDIEFQSIATPDSQDPAAGKKVAPGTTVHVRIGIGD